MKNIVKIGVSLYFFRAGWGRDVQNKGHENLGVKILAAYLGRMQKNGRQKSFETPQNKGFRCIRCFFCLFWGVCARSRFFPQKNLVMFHCPLNMEAVRAK